MPQYLYTNFKFQNREKVPDPAHGKRFVLLECGPTSRICQLVLYVRLKLLTGNL